jgi:hypothetical protein
MTFSPRRRGYLVISEGKELPAFKAPWSLDLKKLMAKWKMYKTRGRRRADRPGMVGITAGRIPDDARS